MSDQYNIFSLVYFLVLEKINVESNFTFINQFTLVAR